MLEFPFLRRIALFTRELKYGIGYAIITQSVDCVKLFFSATICQKVEELSMKWVIKKKNEKKSNFFRGSASKVTNASIEHSNFMEKVKKVIYTFNVFENEKRRKTVSTQIRKQGDVAILEPNGKIVGPSVLELREAIAPQIETSNAPRILINFENVNMIDSSGLGALMEARALATRKQGRIGVIHVGKHIRNLVVLSRLVSMFEHYDDEDAAVLGLSA